MNDPSLGWVWILLLQRTRDVHRGRIGCALSPRVREVSPDEGQGDGEARNWIYNVRTSVRLGRHSRLELTLTNRAIDEGRRLQQEVGQQEGQG